LLTMFMVLSSWHSHCESSPGSFDECRLSAGWPPTLRPNQPICSITLQCCLKRFVDHLKRYNAYLKVESDFYRSLNHLWAAMMVWKINRKNYESCSVYCLDIRSRHLDLEEERQVQIECVPDEMFQSNPEHTMATKDWKWGDNDQDRCYTYGT